MEVSQRHVSIDSNANVSIKFMAFWNATVCALKMEAASFIEILVPICQAEVYDIRACAIENLDRDYKNRNMYILSDSQAAIKALDCYQINSELV
jgi:hypothetical protein